MADIHDRGRALAEKMLAPRPKGNGAALTLSKRIVGEYNPVTGGQDETVAAYAGSGLRTNYSKDDIDGTYILNSDVKMLVSPVSSDGSSMPSPSTNDVIEFDGSSYNVISVNPWNWAGVPCGWACQCRGL